MEPGFASYQKVDFDEFASQLENAMKSLPKQEAKLAQYMSLNLSTLGLETAKSLAKKVGVSEVTVGRLLRRLGYKGMKELKQVLRQYYSVTEFAPQREDILEPHLNTTLDAEIQALTSVFKQTTDQNWKTATDLLTNADKIYVAGFQSVRGIAEDFTRRLAIARPTVQYFSPHDGMLGEWLQSERETEILDSCLVLVDVVPYATEASKLGKLAKSQNRSCIIITDEYCHWSNDIADAVIFSPSNTGLFLESTVGLVAALNLLIDSVARTQPDDVKTRLKQWKESSKEFGFF